MPSNLSLWSLSASKSVISQKFLLYEPHYKEAKAARRLASPYLRQSDSARYLCVPCDLRAAYAAANLSQYARDFYMNAIFLVPFENFLKITWNLFIVYLFFLSRFKYKLNWSIGRKTILHFKGNKRSQKNTIW